MQFNWNFLGRWTGGDSASYDCGRVQSLLSLYVDSMTSRVEREAIDAHIAGCDACRQQSECLRSIHQVVSSRPIAEPPTDLKMRIAQAIAAERAPVRQAPRLRLSYGVLAGACSLILCFAVAEQRYLNNLAAEKPGTTSNRTVVAVNPVAPVVSPGTVKHVVKIKTPAIAHVDNTEVATRVVPETNDVAQPESVGARIRSHVIEGVSEPKTSAHDNQAPIAAPIHMAVKPASDHQRIIVIPKMRVATGGATHPSSGHAAPPVIQLPHVDLPPPTQPTTTQPPAVNQTPPVVVASGDTSNSPTGKNAALLGSVLQKIGQFKLRRGEAQIPFRAVDTALATSTGTVDIVGSHFN